MNYRRLVAGWGCAARWAWLAILLAGCSSGQGGFTLIPTGHFLLDTTEGLRDSAPQGLDLPRELTKTVLDAYVIQPGDVLLIEPEALDSPLRFPTDQTVLADGNIDLGRFGRRMVAGKTVEQIEAEVREIVKAAGEEKSAINVRLITPRSAVYYVLGEVNAPGAFPLVGRETVLDGILAGGGLTARASRCNIILARPTAPAGCRVVLPICYRHIAQIGDTTTNYQLMPGDRIYVASRTLCEQISFWQQNADCEFCCGCQTACPDGYAEHGASPIYRPGPAAGELRPAFGPEEVAPPGAFLGQGPHRSRPTVVRRPPGRRIPTAEATAAPITPDNSNADSRPTSRR